MEQLRKPFGLIILVLFGIPTLFSVTWIVGITRAVSKPEFLPVLPSVISEQLPTTLDLLLEAAQHPQAFEEENTRAWLLAAAEAETTPGGLLEEIGLLDWLREDLTHTLNEIFDVLEGRYRPSEISLDLRPLKRAIHHEAIDRYFLEILENLPPCNPDQQAAWEALGKGRRYYNKRSQRGLPACQPNRATILGMAERLKRGRQTDLPNEVTLFDRQEFQLPAVNVLTLLLIFSLALFLVPATLIILGTIVAEPLGFRSFRWGGIPIILSGLAVLVTAFLPKVILKLSTHLIAWAGSTSYDSLYWPPDLLQELTDRVYHLMLVVIEPLFSPVISTALYVILFGAALYAVHLIWDRNASDSYEPLPPRS